MIFSLVLLIVSVIVAGAILSSKPTRREVSYLRLACGFVILGAPGVIGLLAWFSNDPSVPTWPMHEMMLSMAALCLPVSLACGTALWRLR